MYDQPRVFESSWRFCASGYLGIRQMLSSIQVAGGSRDSLLGEGQSAAQGLVIPGDSRHGCGPHSGPTLFYFYSPSWAKGPQICMLQILHFSRTPGVRSTPMRSTRCHSNRPEDEILTKSSRMNSLKRQAPFKRQLLQISLLTVLNDGSVRRFAIIKTVSF